MLSKVLHGSNGLALVRATVEDLRGIRIKLERTIGMVRCDEKA